MTFLALFWYARAIFTEDEIYWEGMLSMAAELLWILASGQLLASLIHSHNGPWALHAEHCHAFSLQTFLSYVLLFLARTVNKKLWRWHELPDDSRVANMLVLVMLSAALVIIVPAHYSHC